MAPVLPRPARCLLLIVRPFLSLFLSFSLSLFLSFFLSLFLSFSLSLYLSFSLDIFLTLSLSFPPLVVCLVFVSSARFGHLSGSCFLSCFAVVFLVLVWTCSVFAFGFCFVPLRRFFLRFAFLALVSGVLLCGLSCVLRVPPSVLPACFCFVGFRFVWVSVPGLGTDYLHAQQLFVTIIPSNHIAAIGVYK